MHIDNDRWFKLKVDNWISGMNRYPRYGNPRSKKPWYKKDFIYYQIAETLAKGSSYSVQEVEEHLRGRVAAAKLEALLEQN